MKKRSYAEEFDSRGRQNQPHRRTCYNRSNSLQDSHIFVQHPDDSDHEECIGLKTLTEEYLEKELEPGDTLQTLSIQFNCPVAELKRINHIHRDNEVFAHRKIKVPVKYYSLLSEKVVGVHKTSSTNIKNGRSSKSSLNDESVTNISLSLDVSNIHLKDNPDSSLCDAVLINTIYCSGSTSSRDEGDDEESPLISENSESQQTQNNEEVFQCNGSDWGLSWPYLLLCTLLLVFAGPLVYVFYLKEAKHISHISTNTST